MAQVYQCAHCQKQYVSKAWYEKHVAKCNTTETVNHRNINVSVFPFKEVDPDTGEERQGAYLYIDSDHPETWESVQEVVHPIIANLVE